MSRATLVVRQRDRRRRRGKHQRDTQQRPGSSRHACGHSAPGRAPRGTGQRVEGAPSERRAHRSTALSAFANGVGGRLQVGVSDDGRCVGVTNPAARDRDPAAPRARRVCFRELELPFRGLPARAGRALRGLLCEVPAAGSPEPVALAAFRGRGARLRARWRLHAQGQRLGDSPPAGRNSRFHGRLSPIEVRLLFVLLRERRAEARGSLWLRPLSARATRPDARAPPQRGANLPRVSMGVGP